MVYAVWNRIYLNIKIWGLTRPTRTYKKIIWNQNKLSFFIRATYWTSIIFSMNDKNSDCLFKIVKAFFLLSSLNQHSSVMALRCWWIIWKMLTLLNLNTKLRVKTMEEIPKCRLLWTYFLCRIICKSSFSNCISRM